jgi:uncharacterized membrane protein
MIVALERARIWWSGAFWVIPALGVIIGWVSEDAVTNLDELVRGQLAGALSASAAETMLAAVGGGMVTFTGFVFSVVLLMLQFGSATYSPRTVSYFLRMRTTQWVLAVFLGTIVFSFQALITVGSGGEADFVPLFSVVLALAWLMVSLFGFLALLQVVSRALTVDSLLASLGRIAHHSMRRTGRRVRSMDPCAAGSPETEPDGEVIRFAGPPGQVVGISVSRLLRVVERHGADIEMLVQVGDGISTGARIARLRGQVPDHRAIHRGLLVRRERSLAHDPLYALRLLVDIAIRALSTAINDPTTAVRALEEIEGVLRADAPLPLGPLTTGAGAGRLVVRAAGWSDLVDLALLEILEAGRDEPQVSRRMTVLLSDLVEDLPYERHEPLLRYQRRLVSHHSSAPDHATWLIGDRQGLGGSCDGGGT